MVTNPLLLAEQAFASYALGDLPQALEYARQALIQGIRDVALLNLAGACHFQAGQVAEAEFFWRQALRFKPDYAEAANNLAILLKGQKRYDEAFQAYRQALVADGANAHSWFNLGNLMRESGRLAEAEAAYRQALTLQPGSPDFLLNLGILLQSANRSGEAEASFRQVLEHSPDHIEARLHLGLLLQQARRFPEAEALYRQALALQGDNAAIHTHLGNLLSAVKRYAEAEAALRQALLCSGNPVVSLCDLGNFLRKAQRFDEAEACFSQALSLDPDHPESLLNLGLLRLAEGRFTEGWPLYEARRHPDLRHKTHIDFQAPFARWQGESLSGKSLLMVPEQGFGDQIQLCRYAPLLKRRGVTQLTLACPACLQRLFQSLAGTDRLVIDDGKPLPVHDYWVFSGDLPGLLGSTLEAIPATLPYLRPPGGPSFLPEGRFRVGVVWKGNANHLNDASRSLPGLSTLTPLWSVTGVTFVSLQKGAGEEEIAAFEHPLVAMGERLTDFADTAEVVAQLDLVISVDTAVVHLSGALGKRCWVMLPAWSCDFRWMRGRADSPWYPEVLRLFRQKEPDDWAGVVAEVTAALRKLVAG
ncbi:MAG: tetratricopeptide repeat protein [Magnetococcales bacterium]|nr:tetratricopeptide repeat protein [Magnetococcales bacterium]